MDISPRRVCPVSPTDTRHRESEPPQSPRVCWMTAVKTSASGTVCSPVGIWGETILFTATAEAAVLGGSSQLRTQGWQGAHRLTPLPSTPKPLRSCADQARSSKAPLVPHPALGRRLAGQAGQLGRRANGTSGKLDFGGTEVLATAGVCAQVTVSASS